MITILGFIAAYLVMSFIKNKLGEQVYRNTASTLFFCLIIMYAAQGDIVAASICLGYLILIYLLHKSMDKSYIADYISLQEQLDKCVEAGWGNIYKANELRSKMGRIWAQLPNSAKDSILAHEKSIDKAKEA